MTRRAALLMIGVLEEKERAAAVLRRNLEIRRADADAVVSPFPILAVRNESGLNEEVKELRFRGLMR